MIAYLDPGTGSMVAGAVAAGAAGVGVVARMAWSKVSPRARKKARRQQEEQAAQEEATEESQEA